MRLTVKGVTYRLRRKDIDLVAQLQRKNRKLQQEVTYLRAECALKTSSANEWRDRYHNAVRAGV